MPVPLQRSDNWLLGIGIHQIATTDELQSRPFIAPEDVGMESAEHRDRPEEQARIHDLLALLPEQSQSILDAGARDGHVSLRMAQREVSVIALDLTRPGIDHPNVLCVQGDITHLDFPDRSFDTVLCAEVLEHIPPHQLGAACSELQRVAKGNVLIGVPYKQDTRVARTTCRHCGGKNPPWGHVNTFDQNDLAQLFPAMTVERVSFVGQHRDYTNAFSTMLLDWAGNPYGTYDQQEPCIHCGSKLEAPTERTVTQRALTRIAVRLTQAQRMVKRPQPIWIHMLFSRQAA